MMVQGCDCSIVIKTAHCEMEVPYSEETIREAVSFLQEEAAIEGDGICGGIRKNNGVVGCVVTPLSISTVPLLLYLAMGSIGEAVYVSETRNVYQRSFNLLTFENSDFFDLIQNRQGKNEEGKGINKTGKLFLGCKVNGFELRIMRDEVGKLKLDICGENPSVVYPFANDGKPKTEERFYGDSVAYRINNQEYKNIYGLTLISRKDDGVKTELIIKRNLECGLDMPEVIEEMTITAQLTRTQYEERFYGMFRITLKRLVLISDETIVETADTVIGPLRYYVAGNISMEVFSSGGEAIP
jgi:hypothetical protein